MKLNLETNSKEQELVKAYLEENASEVLAEKINNGTPFEKDGKTFINKKTLDGFMKYASSEARKLALKGANSACVEDKVVYGWAVHYFEEDSIEGTLFNEDGTEYKPAPKQASAKVKKVEPKKAEQRQPTLFDFMEPETPEPEVKDDNDDGEDAMPSDEEIQEILAEIAEEDKAEQQKSTTSPVYQKYLNVQDRYPRAVIAMRLGDFYEVFGKNAEILARELPLTLTGRDCGLAERVPMIGFPYHAAEMYFGKILSNGHTLVVMENDNEVRELPAKQKVDLETGELYGDLTEEEMREFDGDIEEPKEQLREEKEIAKSFDAETVAVLSEILGDIFIVR